MTLALHYLSFSAQAIITEDTEYLLHISRLLLERERRQTGLMMEG